MQNTGFDYDVIVAGYGPTGVTAANFLGMQGIRTGVIERDREIYARARAVTLDDFTLRLFQQVGLDEKLLADMETRIVMRWKTYAGKEFLRIQPVENGYGQPASTQVYQPVMEQTLRDGVERYRDNVDVHYGEEVVDVAQDADGVTAMLRDTRTGATRSVRGRYLLAADGGSSSIRKQLGVALKGRRKPRQWIVIDAKVLKWWPECDLITFWSDPVRPVVDVPLALGHHRWEIPISDQENIEDFKDEAAVWRLLTPLGVTPENVSIKNHAFYSHNNLQAERWRVGRVFLLGDAAHMMPPWAGQGMQSGMRDAHNLAWKLGLVLCGGAPDSILDGYQAEREPHVLEMTKLAELLGSFIEEANPAKIALRNTLLPFAQRLPKLGPIIREFRFKPKPSLPNGLIAAAPNKRNLLGRMIPQPVVVRADGSQVRLDDALGFGFSIIGLDCDPRSAMTADQIRAWEDLGARFVAVHGTVSHPSPDDLVDYRGELLSWARPFGVRVIVTRPDRFIFATDREGLNAPVVDAPVLSARGQVAA